MRFALTSLTFLVLAAASGASAQSREAAAPNPGPRRIQAWPTAVAAPVALPDSQRVRPEPRSTGTLALVGVLTGAASLFGGAILGAVLEEKYSPCYCDDPGLEGLLDGALLGPALAIPVSVHLANRRSGSLVATLGASLIAGVAGFAVGAAKDSNRLDGAPFLFAPIAEVVASVAVERAFGH